VRRIISLLPDEVGFLVKGAGIEFPEISQQILVDDFVPERRVLQFLEFEFRKF